MYSQDTEITFRAKDTIVAKDNPKTSIKMSEVHWTLCVSLDGTMNITLFVNWKEQNSSNVSIRSKRTFPVDTYANFIGEQHESMDDGKLFSTWLRLLSVKIKKMRGQKFLLIEDKCLLLREISISSFCLRTWKVGFNSMIEAFKSRYRSLSVNSPCVTSIKRSCGACSFTISQFEAVELMRRAWETVSSRVISAGTLNESVKLMRLNLKFWVLKKT